MSTPSAAAKTSEATPFPKKKQLHPVLSSSSAKKLASGTVPGMPLKEQTAVSFNSTEELTTFDKEGSEESTEEENEDKVTKNQHFVPLFSHMIIMPWPYLVFLPLVFAFLIGFGWTQTDIIEDEVTKIWIPTSGQYAQDVEYAATFGKNKLGATSFAAMSIARDGGNLFRESRLEEIRARMEKTEKTTVTHKGITYTWEDICYTNAGYPYEFPCARLSPMDLFQEAQWFMDYNGPESIPDDPNVPAPKQDLYRRTWYDEFIQPILIHPRVPRFGILEKDCKEHHCAGIWDYRTNNTSDGYSPFTLFADIGDLDLSDKCRICIETNYTNTINTLHEKIGPTFEALTGLLNLFASSTMNETAAQMATDIAAKTEQLVDITAEDVDDFFFYYVTRGIYATLGADAYLEKYALLNDTIAQCEQGALLGLKCPPRTIDRMAAEEALKKHADTAFSSITTAGAPFPLWSEGDGTGYLFKDTLPVGGSGINMSADLESMFQYVETPLRTDDYGDPTSESWEASIAKNPIYAWFVAGLTEADSATACGNGYLTGTNLNFGDVDNQTALLTKEASRFWCTKYSIPNTNNPGEGPYTQQHFARMWYNLLIDSDEFLGLQVGSSDPYNWTVGQGCGYVLRGKRDSYTNVPEEEILRNASRELYFLDEGVSVGVIDRKMLIGDVYPNIGEYSFDFPLTKVGVTQSLYIGLYPVDIIQRVKHCKRPNGPVEITKEDAGEILYQFKEAMENAWTEGWNDKDYGEVQFVGFFDDSNGSVGTTGRMLREITLDNNTLTAISIGLIALFSALFLFSTDWVESRVLVTLIGVALVALAFFGAIGFALLIGVKINVTIAWTLPFIILGLGVDDMYIVLEAIKKQGGYTEHHFLKAMKEVIVPVAMTSIVNACMFAILNISDIPAVYITAQVAVYCVIALFCAVAFCFPAYCYLDLKRQAAGKKDVFFCLDSGSGPTPKPTKDDFRSWLLYDKFYQPIVLGGPTVRRVTHYIIWLVAATLFGTGCYGITQREVGLGLEDFFPSTNQAFVWATKRTEALASWPIGINWGAAEYTKPETQMTMIKQFEDVVANPRVSEMDTEQLWMANFLLWTTRLCLENFDRDDFGVGECGRDIVFPGDNSICSATWKSNYLGLREKIIPDLDDTTCYPHKGGICRSKHKMHPDDMNDILDLDPDMANSDSFCPTVDGWRDEKWQFCLMKWRNSTGFTGGRFVLNDDHGSETDCAGSFNNDETLRWPIPFSAGPSLFAFDLFSHDDTLDVMEQTRDICDNNKDIHCWMTGIPYDYWTQYENIFGVLVELAGFSTLVGFGIAFVFLFVKFMSDKLHARSKIFWGSLIGALLIAVTILLSLVTVVGLSILAGVSLTAFSNMSFVLSVGFAVEYSVHIISRWLRADMALQTGLERVKYTMSFLMLPTFMSFVSSTIGVACLAFTQFEFNEVFFFRPLIIVMFATYFYGCWWLPAALTLINVDVVMLGKHETEQRKKDIGWAKTIAKAEEIPAFTPDQEDTSCRTHPYEQVAV